MGPNIFIVQSYPWTRDFFRCLCVSMSNAMVLLRFLLNTATSSRFPTGNKLFLKNTLMSASALFSQRVYKITVRCITLLQYWGYKCIWTGNLKNTLYLSCLDG